MRTKQFLKNAASVLFLNIIIGILGFIKVHVFVKGLSNDIYSLNQLFYQIFSYIAITDIGFGLLLNKALYKAFAKENHDEINKIYSTSKKFYNFIAVIMIFIALLISLFISYFTKAQVNTNYIRLIFIIFVIKNVIDYFFVAPRCVLEADQKLYKVNHYVKLIKIIETIIEIILVLLKVDYLIILLPGILITILLDIYINKKIFKIYPWLKNNNNFNRKYLKGTKEVIWIKIAGLLGSNTDIILISTFINPITVIIYTSYTYITKFITDTIYLIFASIVPSFANAIIKENKTKSYQIFNEINIFFLFIASFIFVMLYGFLNGLISYWVGPQYLVANTILLSFCFIAFQTIAERPIYMIINSKGLFKETKKATIFESLLNFIISIIFVFKFGLIGVLLGTIISKILTTFIFNPIYIYKNIFQEKPIKYFYTYFTVLIINLTCIIILNILKLTFSSLLNWLIYVIIASVILIMLLFFIYYLLFNPFRLLVKRGWEFIKVRGKYLE